MALVSLVWSTVGIVEQALRLAAATLLLILFVAAGTRAVLSHVVVVCMPSLLLSVNPT